MFKSICIHIINFIQGLFNPSNYTLHNLTIFTIVVMCIQYIPIESRAGVSPLKVMTMAVMPMVLISHFRLNKAFILGCVYMLWIYVSAALINSYSFRASTVLYTSMFVITFIVIYTAIWDYHVFKLADFIYFIRIFFYVLVGVLIVQQIFLIIGIKYFPVINLCQILNRDIGANSLTYEPSTLGRILNVLYYVLLKCYEYQNGEKVKITEVFSGDLKWITILFLWSVLTMGSGTAFVASAITSLYFMRGRYLFLAIPIFAIAIWGMDKIGNTSFDRAQTAALATVTGDTDIVYETDGSAASRIVPMLNTLSIDLTKTATWVGEGCDSSISHRRFYSTTRYLGEINDYGLIAYILGLILIFNCSIQFKSLATIMFFIGVGGGTSNIAYCWGILMIFSVLKYFHDNLEFLIYEECLEDSDSSDTNFFELEYEKNH